MGCMYPDPEQTLGSVQVLLALEQIMETGDIYTTVHQRQGSHGHLSTVLSSVRWHSQTNGQRYGHEGSF